MQRHVERIVVLTLGWIVIGIGVIGLFLPVLQGVLLILLGLYVLSRESRWARRWFLRLRRRFPGIDARLAGIKARLGPRWRRRHRDPRAEPRGPEAPKA